MSRVGLLGLGEVGRVLAEDLGSHHEIHPYDPAFGRDSSASKNLAGLGLVASADPHSVAAAADYIVSAVTAAETLGAARSVSGALKPGTWFIDLNSASPDQKCAAAAVIGQAGGRYVECAVMSPIEPKRLGSPILLGGPHAAEFASAHAAELGFTGAEVYADTFGPASATKLCRSIVVKGLEAIVTESMVTARAWGVEQQVLDSLSNTIPAADWNVLAAYLVSRAMVHGRRRAEEMREAAVTVTATGIEPLLSEAIAGRQDWAAGFAPPADPTDLLAMIDVLRSRVDRPSA